MARKEWEKLTFTELLEALVKVHIKVTSREAGSDV